MVFLSSVIFALSSEFSIVWLIRESDGLGRLERSISPLGFLKSSIIYNSGKADAGHSHRMYFSHLTLLQIPPKSTFNVLNPTVHFWLCYAVHCAEKIVFRHRFCIRRIGGTGEGGVATHKVLCMWQLLRVGCKRTMVGTRWANSHPACMNGF